MLRTLLIKFILLLPILAKTQQVRLGLGPEINFPTGNASNVSGIGFGGFLKAEFAVAEKYAITASGSYNLFIGKRYFGSRTQNLEAVPTKLGFKYYSTPDFYIEGQAGAAFHTGSNAKTSFVWSPGFGTYIKTGSSNNKLDFGLRYEAWTNTGNSAVSNLKTTSFGFIGLKLGYVFGI